MLNDFFDIDSEPIVVDTIKEIDPKICLEGHWEPVETSDTLADLMTFDN
ncbi:hypothetical protein WAA20_16725 [Butyrivibrio fibrisolvens]|nr:hypothetical protein [Butyrivibrio fibrisolvens]